MKEATRWWIEEIVGLVVWYAFGAMLALGLLMVLR